MNLFKKLGFRKADERGRYSVCNAAKFSWIFYTFALLLYIAVELIQNGSTSVFRILMIILFAGQTVFWSIYIYLYYTVKYTVKTSGRYKK